MQPFIIGALLGRPVRAYNLSVEAEDAVPDSRFFGEARGEPEHAFLRALAAFD